MHELTPDEATDEAITDDSIDDDGDDSEVLIDEVDDVDEADDDAPASLDTDRERAVYEISGWSSVMQSGIAEALDVAGIEYEWDGGGDLVVYAYDEARVDEIFDSMPDPDDPDAVLEGADVQEVMTMMWTATGTLVKHPDQPEAVLHAIDAATTMMLMPLPFGFEASVWRDLVAKSTALRDAFESDDEDDQLTDAELKSCCRELHDQLRHFI